METDMSDEEIEALSEEFKSYYVVWKPCHDVQKICIDICLNRTM